MEAGPGPQVATASRKTRDAVSSSQVVLSIPQGSRTNCPHLPGTAPVAALKPRETPQFLANQDSGPAPASSSSQPGDCPLSRNRGIHCPKWTLLPLTRHPCCIAYWTESGHLAPGITDKNISFKNIPAQCLAPNTQYLRVGGGFTFPEDLREAYIQMRLRASRSQALGRAAKEQWAATNKPSSPFAKSRAT